MDGFEEKMPKYAKELADNIDRYEYLINNMSDFINILTKTLDTNKLKNDNKLTLLKKNEIKKEMALARTQYYSKHITNPISNYLEKPTKKSQDFLKMKSLILTLNNQLKKTSLGLNNFEKKNKELTRIFKLHSKTLLSIKSLINKPFSDWKIFENTTENRFIAKPSYAIFIEKTERETGFFKSIYSQYSYSLTKFSLGDISSATLFETEKKAKDKLKKINASNYGSVVRIGLNVESIVLKSLTKTAVVDQLIALQEKKVLENLFEQHDIEKLKEKISAYEEKIKNNEAIEVKERIVRKFKL